MFEIKRARRKSREGRIFGGREAREEETEIESKQNFDLIFNFSKSIPFYLLIHRSYLNNRVTIWGLTRILFVWLFELCPMVFGDGDDGD